MWAASCANTARRWGASSRRISSDCTTTIGRAAPNALAIGAARPIVVVQSELIRLLDAPQRRAVFAHEAAHILSDHQLYRTALTILVMLTRNTRLPLPLTPV